MLDAEKREQNCGAVDEVKVWFHKLGRGGETSGWSYETRLRGIITLLGRCK